MQHWTLRYFVHLRCGIFTIFVGEVVLDAEHGSEGQLVLEEVVEEAAAGPGTHTGGDAT